MEHLSNELDILVARMRRQEEEFSQEQQQRILNVNDEDHRRPNMSPSVEVLQFLRVNMAEDLDAINRMRGEIEHDIQYDIQAFAEGFQYLNEILDDVRNFAEDPVHVDDDVDDNEVIVIEDSDDDDDDDGDAVVAVDVDGDEHEQDVEWDEFSLSDCSSDSGYHGSVSDISDVTFYSTYSDELVHNEVCHFGLLVRPEHVREPVCLQIEAVPGTSSQSPRGMTQSDIQNWLLNTDSAVITGQKRKRDDSDDEADDNSHKECGPKKKKLCKVIRQSKSEMCVHNDNIGVNRSFSEAFLR